MKRFYLIAVALLTSLAAARVDAAEPPNIVWIIVDDMSANFSSFGETLIETPNVDRLAARGVKFTNAFVTAPVCSTCRSAFITGMYQTSIGAHHHRSGRGTEKIQLPAGVELVPQLFQQAGYYTTISGWPIKPGRLGKTDYNFEWDESVYDAADWSGRKPGQPFFAQIQTAGGKLRGASREAAQKLAAKATATFGHSTKPADVVLPPYYPRSEVILEDWAAYLDSVRFTDQMVGEVIKRLRDDGDLENSVILFMTDHGISHARGKQFLYDEGIHVPLVIAGPRVEPSVRDDLVEHIDVAALSLGLAGIPIPDNMQARDILADDYQPRDAVFSARDRCDETVDHIRSVRTNRFKYIRNFLPHRPHLQPCAYKDAKAVVASLRSLHAEGQLDELQGRIFNETRPAEELYDVVADPYETINLAADPKFSAVLSGLRGRLDRWMEETDDQGRVPESAERYDSDMKVYVDSLKIRKKDPAHIRRIEENIALMKQWAAAGK
jgi:arylsulfatase A-like enzyme